MADDQTKLSDEKISKARNVAPTLLIGLGGTGKEVLLRFRRRLYERYGIFGFPTTGYLWIDTDTRNRNIDDQPLDHIMQQVMLRGVPLALRWLLPPGLPLRRAGRYLIADGQVREPADGRVAVRMRLER